MLTERSIEGLWYLPDDPDWQVAGTLSFTADAFELDLRGPLIRPRDLTPGREYGIGQAVAVPVVWGISRDRPSRVTLLSIQGSPLSLPRGFGTTVFGETWRPEVALLGAHLDSAGTFSEISLTMEHLDEWALVPPLHGTVTTDPEGRLSSYEVKVERREIARGEVEDVGRVTLVSGPQLHETGREATVATHSYLRVELYSPRGWKDAYRDTLFMRDLVRLAAGSPTALEEVRLIGTAPAGQTTPVSVECLLRTTAMDRRKFEAVDRVEMSFGCDTIPGGFEAGLNVWRGLRSRYRQAWNELTKADDVRVLDVQDRLVSLVKAVLILHTLDFGRPPAATAEGDERVERALEAMPADLKGWARPLLEESNPPFARHRVIEVVHELGDLGLELVGGDGEQFAAEVVATRNELSHPTGRVGKNQLVDVDEMFWYGQALGWLVSSYLLLKLGATLADLSHRVRQIPKAATAIGRMTELAGHRRGA